MPPKGETAQPRRADLQKQGSSVLAPEASKKSNNKNSLQTRVRTIQILDLPPNLYENSTRIDPFSPSHATVLQSRIRPRLHAMTQPASASIGARLFSMGPQHNGPDCRALRATLRATSAGSPEAHKGDCPVPGANGILRETMRLINQICTIWV